MLYSRLLFLSTLCLFLTQLQGDLGDFVAQALAEGDLNDALFLTKTLKENNHPEANIGYAALFRSKFFNKDKTKLDAALAQIPMAAGVNPEQFKNHQGAQAVDDMIAMFSTGPGAAVYKKLAPLNYQQAINSVTQALASTKSMLK